jgi:hypothetical protein
MLVLWITRSAGMHSWLWLLATGEAELAGELSLHAASRQAVLNTPAVNFNTEAITLSFLDAGVTA